MSTRSAPPRRSGFSLIEVAIALALFVFGALAIVQIFPPALAVIRNNESRVVATQVGESTLAKFQSRHSPPPEAIFDVDAASTLPYKWNDYGGAVVGTVSKNNSLPKEPTDPAYNTSALGHFRYIYGEPHYIAPGQTILLNHPYDDTLNNLSFFIDEFVEGVQISDDGYLDFTNATNADTNASYNDAANGNPKRSPEDRRGPDCTYYVSYRWREYVAPGTPPTYTSIKGVVEEPLKIPTNTLYSNTTSARVLPCFVNSANRVIPGGAKVRVRRNLTLTTTGAIDLGSQRKIISISNSGSTGATLYCNYLASDWRNMASDNAPLNNLVELPVTGIETNTLLGILTNSNRTTPPTLKPPDLSTPDKVKRAEKGTVEFAASSGAGARMRTVYRSLDGWAHQISVAPRSYIPYDANRTGDNFPREPWREYQWRSGDSGMLYFHPSEAGKTVSISFIDGTGATVNSVSTIGDDFLDAASLGISTGATGFAVGGQVVRMAITGVNGNPPASVASILSVQGMSIHARTAWFNNDRYNQVIVPAYRTLMQ